MRTRLNDWIDTYVGCFYAYILEAEQHSGGLVEGKSLENKRNKLIYDSFMEFSWNYSFQLTFVGFKAEQRILRVTVSMPRVDEKWWTIE